MPILLESQQILASITTPDWNMSKQKYINFRDNLGLADKSLFIYLRKQIKKRLKQSWEYYLYISNV